MENNDNITMSRIAFERMQSKDEKNDRWRNIIIIILIVLLAATNGAWLYAWNQYDYSSTQTVDVDAKVVQPHIYKAVIQRLKGI